MSEGLTLKKFEEASEIVNKVTLNTNLIYSDYFSEQTGNKVYIKPENMQFTGAYKVRGAYYKIKHINSEKKELKDLITASAGNHAQGVAYAAKLYGVKAVNRYANYYTSYEGKQNKELWCRCNIIWRCL